MPKCVKCNEMVPPQFMTEMDGVNLEVKQCLFCKMDTKTITMPPDEAGNKVVYTKEEAMRDYHQLLNKLKDKVRSKEDLKKFMKGEY